LKLEGQQRPALAHLHLLEVEDLLPAGGAGDFRRLVRQAAQRPPAARVVGGLCGTEGTYL